MPVRIVSFSVSCEAAEEKENVLLELCRLLPPRLCHSSTPPRVSKVLMLLSAKVS